MSERRRAKLVIGTRGSDLAVKQAEEVRNAILSNCPELKGDDVVLKKIKTTGDKILNQTLSKIGGKGLFTKEIEESLLKGDIDMAVHSMKDVPAIATTDLEIKAILKREDPRDAFISNKYPNIESLPQGASVATSSLRRQAILLNLRPDLEMTFIRGNINTRLQKLDNAEADAIILAACGLKRISYSSRITQYLDEDLMLPAIGQGAIGVEIKKDNVELGEILRKINDPITEKAVLAERIFMLGVDGDCRTPMAAHAEVNGEEIKIRSLVLYPDGSKKYTTEITGALDDYVSLAEKLVTETKREAKDILDYIKRNS